MNMASDVPIEPSGLIIDLFRYLEQTGTEYCVVGRTQDLSNLSDGDIDIVVSGIDSYDLIQKIQKWSEDLCIYIVQILKHEQTALYIVLTPKKRALRERLFLKLDFCTDYLREGRLFLASSEILSGRRRAVDAAGRERIFYVARPPQEFIYYLLKKIDKGSLDAKQGEHLSTTWQENPAGARMQVERFWPERQVQLIAHAAHHNDWDEVRKSLPELRRSLRAALRPQTLTMAARELARKVDRIWYPTGLHIAFLGPDGSGKSTVIRHTAAGVAPAFRRTQIAHLRPALGMGLNSAGPVTDPHRQPPWSWPVSLVKLLYLLADYTIGYVLKVWPQSVRSTLVLFDRYYHDLLVDPRRYRYGGPMWMARLIGRMVPKPDLWILLDAPPEVLQARKQEVPFEETARQREAYLSLSVELGRAVVVDASQPLDMVVADVNGAILTYMADRVHKRLGISGSHDSTLGNNPHV